MSQGTIVRVKRDTLLVLPFSIERKEGARYLQVEHKGPDTFDVTHLEPWFHPVQQRGGFVSGYAIRTSLVRGKLVPRCLDMYDLEAIRQMGKSFFEKYFHDKPIFAWKTRALDDKGHPRVSCLMRNPDPKSTEDLVVKWGYLHQHWRHDVPVWILPDVAFKQDV